MYERPQDYLFHRSPMLLLENVREVSANAVTCTVALNSPLLAPFKEPQGLPSYFGIELMAQTVGIWSGYHDKCSGRAAASGGLILSVRAFSAQSPFLTGSAELIITMQQLLQDGSYASFEGTITHAGQEWARGRLSLCQLDPELEHKLGLSA